MNNRRTSCKTPRLTPRDWIGVLVTLLLVFAYVEGLEEWFDDALLYGPWRLEMGNGMHLISNRVGRRGQQRQTPIAPAGERLALLCEQQPNEAVFATVVLSDFAALHQLPDGMAEAQTELWFLADRSRLPRQPTLSTADLRYDPQLIRLDLSGRNAPEVLEAAGLRAEDCLLYAAELRGTPEELTALSQQEGVAVVDPHWIENPWEYCWKERVWPRFKSNPTTDYYWME